jgi:hypothetical protein
MQLWLDNFGGALAYTLLGVFLLAAPVLAGRFLVRRTGKVWLGWVVGTALLLGLYMIMGRSLHALKSVACRGSTEYQACVDGENLDY